jgi:hypothetical protein
MSRTRRRPCIDERRSSSHALHDDDPVSTSSGRPSAAASASASRDHGRQSIASVACSRA